jgi:dipicolinate synthase subunit B
MAAKSHLRNGRPLLIAVSTNDALGAAAENIGKLIAKQNYYFVPFGQDDAAGKPRSLIADFALLPAALDAALEGKQLQPILL